MSISEFELINNYFVAGFPHRADVAVQIGDDAAALVVPRDMCVACAMETIAGKRARAMDASALAEAVCTSTFARLAERSAKPAWATLALTLPAADPAWLDIFAGTLRQHCRLHDVALIGGDTTRGPLAVTFTVCGLRPRNRD